VVAAFLPQSSRHTDPDKFAPSYRVLSGVGLSLQRCDQAARGSHGVSLSDHLSARAASRNGPACQRSQTAIGQCTGQRNRRLLSRQAGMQADAVMHEDAARASMVPAAVVAAAVSQPVEVISRHQLHSLWGVPQTPARLHFTRFWA